MAFEELKNQIIENVFISKDKERLAFVTKDNYFVYNSENDYCNNVFFNDVLGVETLFGAVVLELENKGWIDVPNANYGDVVEDGFFTIKTNKGYCDIVLRNEHNGYYGGAISNANICSEIHMNEYENFKIEYEQYLLDNSLTTKKSSRTTKKV